MTVLPIAIALLPTLGWLAVTVKITHDPRKWGWIAAATLAGILIGLPVWLAETLVDGTLIGGGRVAEDAVQQVLGAAICEETFKFVAAVVIARVFVKHFPGKTSFIIAICVSVGIGFMTLENMIAVAASKSPSSMALNRLLTVVAGHPSYQLLMGWLLARGWQERRSPYWLAAWFLPVLLHGWADLSETLFQDEPRPGSTEDSILYGTWIASIVTTAILTAALLPRWARQESSNSEAN